MITACVQATGIRLPPLFTTDENGDNAIKKRTLLSTVVTALALTVGGAGRQKRYSKGARPGAAVLKNRALLSC